jgi:hypothetical protein
MAIRARDQGVEEGEVVGCKFIVARCDTPTSLDRVEEPLDPIAAYCADRSVSSRP